MSIPKASEASDFFKEHIIFSTAVSVTFVRLKTGCVSFTDSGIVTSVGAFWITDFTESTT